jgi:hypothetical protein
VHCCKAKIDSGKREMPDSLFTLSVVLHVLVARVEDDDDDSSFFFLLSMGHAIMMDECSSF